MNREPKTEAEILQEIALLCEEIKHLQAGIDSKELSMAEYRMELLLEAEGNEA